VYCSWDFSKAQEGDNVSSPFTVRTLDEMGPIFDNAHKLVNCSIGEPFMKKDIDPLLDSFGERGKLLEIATNGQILTDSNIRKLLGRNVHLLISLEAATPETYARLRNDTFSRIVENVQRLVNAKGGPGHLPIVDLIFMPMRVNVHEAEAFVRLCEELRVDRLVLRPLNLGEGLDLEWERGGYRFEYAKEVLAFDELVRLSGRVAELCRRLDVTLSDQLDFGGRLRQRFRAEYEAGRSEVAAAFESPPAPSAEVTAATASPGPETSDAAAVVAETTASPAPAPEPRAEGDRAEPGDLGESRLPLCIEPWQSLYVLRRGTLACCYGAPVAGMNEYSQAWNSSVLQEIRGELAEGRFHSYCLKSPDCPIVRKADHAGMPSGPEPGRPHDRGTVVTAAGRLRGWPARAYHLGKRLVTRGLGRV
jgi:hypothetical protein